MEEILDTTIGRFRIVGIQYTQKEIQKLRNKSKQQIRNFKNATEWKKEDDVYIGSVKDVAVGMILAQFLRQKLSLPLLDCSAIEEEGYALPEFSIYYNQDARSWCGKWTHSNDSQTYDESGIFFALAGSDQPEYKTIQNLLECFFTEYFNIAIAILERKCIE